MSFWQQTREVPQPATPHFVMFKNGQYKETQVGYVSKSVEAERVRSNILQHTLVSLYGIPERSLYARKPRNAATSRLANHCVIPLTDEEHTTFEPGNSQQPWASSLALFTMPRHCGRGQQILCRRQRAERYDRPTFMAVGATRDSGNWDSGNRNGGNRDSGKSRRVARPWKGETGD